MNFAVLQPSTKSQRISQYYALPKSDFAEGCDIRDDFEVGCNTAKFAKVSDYIQSCLDEYKHYRTVKVYSYSQSPGSSCAVRASAVNYYCNDFHHYFSFLVDFNALNFITSTHILNVSSDGAHHTYGIQRKKCNNGSGQKFGTISCSGDPQTFSTKTFSMKIPLGEWSM